MSASQSTFRDRTRIRVCGLLVEDDSILLAQILSPVTKSLVWIPPGGGLQFGETMGECLRREFHEETNLQIEIRNLIHINELVADPFHALELFFEVERQSGEIKLGSDPEMPVEKQLLKDLNWFSIDRLPEKEFAPQSLLKKLQDWSNRSSFQV
jgi:8-oxo-dGTP diphosphatase